MQGVPVAALPLRRLAQRRPPAPDTAPPPPAPLAEAPGPPLTINRGGVAVQNAPAAVRRDIAPVNAPGWTPVPPASIPYAGVGAPSREKSLLGKLFGGA